MATARTIFARFERRSTRACYPRLVALIERAVGDGTLKRGERLPTHRALAAHLGVAIGTVTRAYSEAERRGLIVGEIGRGTYVTARGDHVAALATGAVIDMTINRPPNDGAARHFANALRCLSKRRDIGDVLGIEPTNGWPRHRHAAARWIQRRRRDIRPAEVLTCNGVQHALSVVLTALTQPGDVIATEELNYPGIRMLAELNRLRVVGIPMDREGLQPEKLEAVCRRQRIRMLICSPTTHNPTTVTLSLERRSQLAVLANDQDFLILENDILGMMPREPLPTLSGLARNRSCYVTGLTKIAGAGFRLAFVAAPSHLLQYLTRAVHGSTWMPPPLLFELFTLWLDDGTLDEIIEWHRCEIAARVALLARMLRPQWYSADPSAYHVWVKLPCTTSATQFQAALATRGVLVVPGPSYTVVGSDLATDNVRLSLGGLNDRARIQQALVLVRNVLSQGKSASTPIST
jgi:DNA-binding transcriptional MocR family regulator